MDKCDIFYVEKFPNTKLVQRHVFNIEIEHCNACVYVCMCMCVCLNPKVCCWTYLKNNVFVLKKTILMSTVGNLC